MSPLALLLLAAAPVAAAGPTDSPAAIAGTWSLDSAASRLGAYAPLACKTLAITAQDGGLTIAFAESAGSGALRTGRFALSMDGRETRFAAPVALSPSDGWDKDAGALAARTEGGMLVLEEGADRRIDRTRTTRIWRDGAGLVAETLAHSIIGDRSARLVYRPGADPRCPIRP